jgi:hypothetical protein
LERPKPRKYIQDWLELDEGDPGFQLVTEEEIVAVICLSLFISITYIINFSSLFTKFVFVF